MDGELWAWNRKRIEYSLKHREPPKVLVYVGSLLLEQWQEMDTAYLVERWDQLALQLTGRPVDEDTAHYLADAACVVASLVGVGEVEERLTALGYRCRVCWSKGEDWDGL